MPRWVPLGPAGRSDEPSLEERFGLLALLRVAMAGVVALVASLAPAQLGLGAVQVALPCLGLAGVAVATSAAGRLDRRAALAVQRAGLVADVAFVLVVTAPSGGVRSPAAVLFCLHLVATATLVSGPAAAQVVLWDVAGTVVLATTPLRHALCRALGAPTPPPLPPAGLLVAAAGLAALAALTAGLGQVSERELRRSRSELADLAAMAADLERRTDPADVAAACLVATADAFRARRAALVHPDGPHLVVTAPGRAPEQVTVELPLTSDSVLTAARASGRPVGRRRLDREVAPVAATLLPDARTVVCVALGAAADAPVLLLELRTRGDVVARRTLVVAGQFAAQGALALASAALLAERERLAAVDGVTGLANRRAFDDGLTRAVAAARRRREPLALVMVDIDHFKLVNDTRGHVAGDDVLRRVAGVLAGACRAQDLVARYGGEEFAMVLPACPADAAAAIVERARRQMAEVTTLAGVTVSAGVASLPDHAADGPSLVEVADAALYAAKAAGRDRVVLAGS